MKINRLLSVCMCMFFTLITLTSCGKFQSNENNQDIIVGKWKSEIGIELEIYEDCSYWRTNYYEPEKWLKLENKNEYEFIDREGVSQFASFSTSKDGDCLEIENWGKFYRVDVVEKENNKKGFEYLLKYATAFKDNRNIIEYKDQNGQEYAALIDTKGNILYKEPNAHILNPYIVESAFSGIGVIFSDQSYTILNNAGKIIATSQDGEFDKVLASGDGLAFVYKDNSNINGASHCYGVIDDKGNWKQPLTQINDLPIKNEARYAGDGVFQIWSLYHPKNIWVYSSKTGKAIETQSYNYMYFQNGEGYFQEETNIYKIDTELNITAVTGFDTLLKGKLIKTKDTEHVKIFNPTTQKTVTLSKYDANQIEVDFMEFSGNDTFVIIQGKDGNRYYTIIDEDGNEYYEPKKIEGSYIYDRMKDFNFSESKLSYQSDTDAYNETEHVSFEDINGNIIAENVPVYGSIESIMFGNDIALLKAKEGYIFVNSQGETILKKLYE